jgi:hypothetical protein
MSAELLTQVRSYYEQIDERQAPIRPDPTSCSSGDVRSGRAGEFSRGCQIPPRPGNFGEPPLGLGGGLGWWSRRSRAV